MRSAVLIALVLSVLALARPVSMADESRKDALVVNLVKEIKSSSPSERPALANKLSDLIWHMDRSELDMINKNTIDEIAMMLSDKSEAVVYAAASALGDIGQPAIHTVPALLTALKELEASHSRGPVRPAPSIGAEDAIVNTLIKLKVCVPPSRIAISNSCDYLLR